MLARLAVADGLGLGRMPQLLPFQCSTSVLIADAVETLPTAKQLFVVGQATALKLAPVEPLGLGFGWVFQMAAAPAGAETATSAPAASPTDSANVENLERRERLPASGRPAQLP
jgi:hypothetical protein